MTEADTSARHDVEGPRWLVQFDGIRMRTERQRDAIANLDPDLLRRVLEIWLKVLTPDASLERQSAPHNLISFRVRSDARRFIASFGGRLLAPPSSNGGELQ